MVWVISGPLNVNETYVMNGEVGEQNKTFAGKGPFTCMGFPRLRSASTVTAHSIWTFIWGAVEPPNYGAV